MEEYRLTTFLGQYGKGRVLKTLSLLPGERARLTMFTYRHSEQTTREASTIFDSFSTAQETEQTTQIQTESSNQSAYERTAGASARASFSIWRISGGSAEASLNTRLSRESLYRTVSGVTSRQVNQASARRDVTIDTSLETRVAFGEEFGTVREIENVNLPEDAQLRLPADEPRGAHVDVSCGRARGLRGRQHVRGKLAGAHQHVPHEVPQRRGDGGDGERQDQGCPQMKSMRILSPLMIIFVIILSYISFIRKRVLNITQDMMVNFKIIKEGDLLCNDESVNGMIIISDNFEYKYVRNVESHHELNVSDMIFIDDPWVNIFIEKMNNNSNMIFIYYSKYGFIGDDWRMHAGGMKYECTL